MMRLIDADAFEKKLDKLFAFTCECTGQRPSELFGLKNYIDSVKSHIRKQPTIEAIPLDIHIAEVKLLEKALDKACRELDFYSRGPYEEPIIEVDWTVEQWKEWCMKDDKD